MASISFNTRIQKFGKKGEKSGWTYIEISKSQAEKLNPGIKVSFRVKGQLDSFKIEKQTLVPMGDGGFILPINASLRKGTGKKEGDILKVSLQLDKRELELSSDFMECLAEEPAALNHFKSLTKGHQHYFSKWIESAKTTPTKTKRIVMALTALSKGKGFPEMLRENKGR
ncbi:MAG TPA: YdeI/OmpD-associated family protein [Cyclobacteriaceae bacterium]|nr:YdeI/OmpD-associated family protein [Cyclobacteriaceae bacterium]